MLNSHISVVLSPMLSRSAVQTSQDLRLAFSGDYTTDIENLVIELFNAVIYDATQVDRLHLGSLRYILVSSEFVTDVSQWLLDLGRPVVVTNTDEAVAMGKTISWHDEASSQLFSALILSDQIVGGALEQKPGSIGVIYHELAHVHDDSRRHAVLGPERHPSIWDLSNINAQLAGILWAEYFAERVASRHHTPELRADFILNAETIASFLDCFHIAKTAYRTHCDITSLWQYANQTISVVAGHLGRSLGELHPSVGAAQQYDQFLASLPHQWSLIAQTAHLPLDKLFEATEWLDSSLEPLTPIVKQMYSAIGIFPRSIGGELYIDVP